MDKVVKLDMKFKDSQAGNFNLSLDDPNLELESEELKSKMEEIVELGIFENKSYDIVAVDSASYITRTVEKIF